MSWDLAHDPRAKSGVVNRIWQTMAAHSCNAISKYKLNLPLHVSMYLVFFILLAKSTVLCWNMLHVIPIIMLAQFAKA